MNDRPEATRVMHSETAKRALRFENGLIAEDWSVTDTLAILRQAGVIRALLMVLRSLRPG